VSQPGSPYGIDKKGVGGGGVGERGGWCVGGAVGGGWLPDKSLCRGNIVCYRYIQD